MLTLKVPAPDADRQFTPAPAGVWPATCVKIIDVGTQANKFDLDQKPARKIVIFWELDTDERMSDGRPFTVSRWLTASLAQSANLRKLLVSWFGKAPTEGSFDLSKLLGRGCQIQLVHKEKDGEIRAQIAGVMPLSKGMKAPEPSITPFVFSLEAFDEDLFSTLSDNMKKTIEASPEYQAILNPPKPAQTVRVVPAAKPTPAQVAGFGGPRTIASQSEPASFDDDLNDEIPF